MPNSSEAPRSADIFRPVATARISGLIAEQIRKLIRSGELAVGSRLPSERELCERFQVSRLPLREALRMLETNGLIEIRLGARGGAFVTAPSARRVGEGIRDLLSMSALTSTNVTEARMLLELGLVPLVCERATDEDIADLHRLCDEAEVARDAGTYTVATSFGFHLRLAAASHNPAIAMLLQSFDEEIIESLQQARHEGKSGVEEHRAVLDAVVDKDVERACRVMAAHLRRTADRVGQ